MRKSKKALYGSAMAFILLLGGAMTANASIEPGKNDEFVTAISKKFNLKESEVKSFLTEQKTIKENTKKLEQADKLSKLVKDGKLTQDQVNKIIAKRTEIEAQVKSQISGTNTLSPIEMKNKMDSNMLALKAWAKDNNIPFEYIMPFGNDMHKHHNKHKSTNKNK